MYADNPKPQTEKPITLWRGIDTIKIGIGGQNNTNAVPTLRELQEQVRQSPAQYQYDLAGKIWAILPYGRKKYRYGLQHGQLSIFFSEEEYSPETPNIMAEAYPSAIAGRNVHELQNDINVALAELGVDPNWTKVSELHLTTDTHVPEKLAITDIYDTNHNPLWISKARKVQAITDHQQDVERLITRGATLQSLRYGGSMLHVRIYNKQEELKIHPEKQWEMTLWNNPYAQHVTRVEFQIRREKLKCFRVDGTQNLPGQIAGIWKYLTEEWFTLNERNPNGKNRDATASQFWETVQAAWKTSTPRTPYPKPQANAGQRLSQAYGNLISAAAILDMHQEEQITDLFKIWQNTHGQEWAEQVRQRQDKIATLQGRIRIRDQALELEFEEQNCAPTTPLLKKTNEKKPEISLFAHLEGGMLLTIPGEKGRSAAQSTRTENDIRQEPTKCGKGFTYA